MDFVANARGSVPRSAYAGGHGLFLRRGGRLDVVSYCDPLQWRLADNDDVITIDRVGEWRPPDYPSSDKPAGNVVLVWSGDRVRVPPLLSAPPTGFVGSPTSPCAATWFPSPSSEVRISPTVPFFYRPSATPLPREIPCHRASGGILDFIKLGPSSGTSPVRTRC